MYSQGGYFGDADLISYLTGNSDKSVRDMTAIGFFKCSIFFIELREINVIKDSFKDIFEEMVKMSNVRYKNH